MPTPQLCGRLPDQFINNGIIREHSLKSLFRDLTGNTFLLKTLRHQPAAFRTLPKP